MSGARVLALYLPQFHPVKENDEIWGKGFTEWINVAKARPVFRGHYQPQLPSELGFYDLRMEEVRQKQADLAREYGIEGFCYWHYWFGNGKRILQTPAEMLLSTQKPDFPFCFAWANHSWATSTWNNAKTTRKDHVFLKQEYLGIDDYTQHFYAMLPYFKDQRYITVDEKPLFAVFDPTAIPDEEIKLFIDTWQKLAMKNGLKGIHFVARLSSVMYLTDKDVKYRIKGGYVDYYNKYLDLGFDAIWANNMRRAEILEKGYYSMFIRRALIHAFGISILDRYKYSRIIKRLFTEEDKKENVYPMIIPRWDKTPRQGKKASIYYDGSPDLFQDHVKDVVNIIKDKDPQHQIVFLQAWNEWGEGNYMEPDIKYGRGYLEALKKGLTDE